MRCIQCSLVHFFVIYLFILSAYKGWYKNGAVLKSCKINDSLQKLSFSSLPSPQWSNPSQNQDTGIHWWLPWHWEKPAGQVHVSTVQFITTAFNVNQSVSQTVNKSVIQSFDRSINPSIDPSINHEINQTIMKSISIDQTINRSIDQSITWSINQLINQSILFHDRKQALTKCRHDMRPLD